LFSQLMSEMLNMKSWQTRRLFLQQVSWSRTYIL